MDRRSTGRRAAVGITTAIGVAGLAVTGILSGFLFAGSSTTTSGTTTTTGSDSSDSSGSSSSSGSSDDGSGIQQSQGGGFSGRSSGS